MASSRSSTVGDMLIALYRLPVRPPSAPDAVAMRKPLGPEHDVIVRWVSAEFSAGWASEAGTALCNRPVSLFVAIRAGALLGFCAYDATARGLVGPVGVTQSARGQGVGASLLHACLRDMRSAGYAYAVAGAVGAPDFFRRVAGAVPIEGSTPGLYQELLRP